MFDQFTIIYIWHYCKWMISTILNILTMHKDLSIKSSCKLAFAYYIQLWRLKEVFIMKAWLNIQQMRSLVKNESTYLVGVFLAHLQNISFKFLQFDNTIIWYDNKNVKLSKMKSIICQCTLGFLLTLHFKIEFFLRYLNPK